MKKNIGMIRPFKYQKIFCYVALAITLSMAITETAYAENRNDRGRHDGYNGGDNKDNWRNRGRGNHQGWNRHEYRTRRYWNQPYYAPEPRVVYAPPVVYYPEPQYVEPSFNLIFPLHIR
jgi:hypothetical protein